MRPRPPRASLRYWFPLVTPILAAAVDLVFRLLPGRASPLWEVFVVHFPVTLMFTCITIDIWGLTTASDATPGAPSELIRLWVLLLLIHLVLYATGLLFQRSVLQSSDPSAESVLAVPILGGVAIVLAWWGRERAW